MTAMPAKIESVQPVLMVRDLASAIRFYQSLGFEHTFSDSADRPRYAGIRRDAVELHLQWHDAIEWSYPNDRPTYRFVVSNLDQLFKEFTVVFPALDRTDVATTAWGTREFHVRDLDGNGLQFYCAYS